MKKTTLFIPHILFVVLAFNCLMVFANYPEEFIFDHPVNSQLIPPSANAAALGQYGFSEANLYSGTVQFSIPIYTIKNGDISVPISMSYNHAGLKVDERATWVGLGWTMQAGGVITKVVRGLDDESPTGYYFTSEYYDFPDPTKNNPSNLENELSITEKLKFSAGELDGAQDIYYYNFNGISGKFIWTHDGFNPHYSSQYRNESQKSNKIKGFGFSA